MRGLRKYLTPFAPDQSGAVSVLYELGGIVVICDAGGCTGNICGFDEPRWHSVRSAVFSAGLRDMDAIMGRDDKLVAELADAAGAIEAGFAAIIGTPVPSVIGTDYLALRRMAERQLSIPVITADTTGMELYDTGAEKAYLEIFRRFAREEYEVIPGRTGVLGVNPLDMSDTGAADKIRKQIDGAVCYGMGSGLEDIISASSAEKNIVAAPSGLKAAKLLNERFGTPYEIYDPLAAGILSEALGAQPQSVDRSLSDEVITVHSIRTDNSDQGNMPDARVSNPENGTMDKAIDTRTRGIDISGKRVLIVDQQVRANTMRNMLVEMGAASVDCATWFLQLTDLAAPGDVKLREEDNFEMLVYNGDYDILICDGVQKRIVPEYRGTFVDIPQFPVSGRLGGKTHGR